MATATKTKSKIRLQPLGERLVVQREEGESTTAGGIVLPDSAREKPQQGLVEAVGSGAVLENGSVRAPSVKKGDRILFGKYSGSEVKLDGEELVVMKEDDIMAIIGGK